jgi:hypothetical protein
LAVGVLAPNAGHMNGEGNTDWGAIWIGLPRLQIDMSCAAARM